MTATTNAQPVSTPAKRLTQLPQDCAELICKELGSDLGRFASVSSSTQRITEQSNVWRDAYQARYEDVVEDWGRDAAMPDSLWRACMVRESGPKSM